MPPLPRMSTTVLERLVRERRGQSAATLRRDAERAEALAADIEPAGTYPEDFVVFRVTGSRPSIDRPAMLRGAELLADLSAFVERLSHTARFSVRDVRSAAGGDGALDADGICRRWKVSRRTVERYRRQGLVAWRALGDDGKPRLLFRAKAVDAFERRNGEVLRRAGSFSRIEPEIEAKILRRALRYRRRFGCTINQAARRLGERFNRSQEAIRLLIRRSEARGALGAERIFNDPAPLTARQRRVIFRAMLRAIEPTRIARRYRKPRGSVQRAFNLERAERLRGLLASGALAAHRGPTFDRPDAPEVILGAAPAHSGLGGASETDLLRFVESASTPVVPVGVEESLRAVAYNYLKDDVGRRIAALDRLFPSTTELDVIETRLRWAARLKAELLRPELRLVVQNLEAGLGCSLKDLRAAEARAVIEAALERACAALDSFDPFKGRGRIASPLGVAVNKLAAKWVRERAIDLPLPAKPGARKPGRATPRLTAGTPIEDWTRRVEPWQKFVEPDRRLRPALAALDAACIAVLARRFGWQGPGNEKGEAPLTVGDLSKVMKWSRIRAAKEDRRALAAALAAVRGGHGR